MKLKLALVGKDVSASSSPRIHKFIAEHTGNEVEYAKLSVPECEFESAIESILKEYDGLNVTIPYKLSVIPHLEKIFGDALSFGAVNTVKCRERHGYNTDGLGFSLMLKNAGADVSGRRALVIGAGGAGRSVAKKLSDAGADVYVYDKNCVNARAVAKEFSGVTALERLDALPYYCIVNASGVGMHNTVGQSPADDNLIKLCEVAADLIYNPPESGFLKLAALHGKKTINGEAMLFYQAYFSQCIYFGAQPDTALAKRLFKQYREEKI